VISDELNLGDRKRRLAEEEAWDGNVYSRYGDVNMYGSPVPASAPAPAPAPAPSNASAPAPAPPTPPAFIYDETLAANWVGSFVALLR
jgi:hypothetical protein